jgi:type IV pilus assembly protein PilX
MKATAVVTSTPHCLLPLRQRGVLLIITLIMLVVISGVAALSIKGSGSSEALANNVRTQGLALQAAEAALRYCEIGAINQNLADRGEPLTKAPTQGFAGLSFPIRPPPLVIGGTTPPSYQPADWQALTAWQGTAATYIATPIPLATLDAMGSASSSSALVGSFASVYRRAPDCIVQYAENTGETIMTVVARGFGPEVAAAPASNPGEIPHGSEVFLQAIVKLPP